MEQPEWLTWPSRGERVEGAAGAAKVMGMCWMTISHGHRLAGQARWYVLPGNLFPLLLLSCHWLSSSGGWTNCFAARALLRIRQSCLGSRWAPVWLAHLEAMVTRRRLQWPWQDRCLLGVGDLKASMQSQTWARSSVMLKPERKASKSYAGGVCFISSRLKGL